MLKYTFLIFYVVEGDPLLWLDKEAQKEYNWSHLERPTPYEIYSEGYKITFNIGKSTETRCGDKEGSVIREAPGECSNLGMHESSIFDELSYKEKTNYGISLTYIGTSRCPRDVNSLMKTTFKLFCSIEDSPFQLQTDPSSCHLEFTKKDIGGCPFIPEDAPMSNVLLAFGLIILVFITLCLAIFIDDEEYYEEEEEALPMWREMKTVVRKTKQVGKRTLSYIQYVKPGYEAV